MGEVLDRTDLLVTVSSTAALESLHRRIPTVVLSDLGVREALGNHHFVGSGCLASWDQLDAGHRPVPDPQWVARQGVAADGGYKTAFDEARGRIAALLARPGGLPPLAPYYTLGTAPGYLPGILAATTSPPTAPCPARPAADRAPGPVRQVVRRAARGAYRHGVQRVAPVIRRMGSCDRPDPRARPDPRDLRGRAPGNGTRDPRVTCARSRSHVQPGSGPGRFGAPGARRDPRPSSSKGVPAKNLAPVGGVPLVVRAVRECLAARLVTDVVVSTDDRAICRGGPRGRGRGRAAARRHRRGHGHLRGRRAARHGHPRGPARRHHRHGPCSCSAAEPQPPGPRGHRPGGRRGRRGADTAVTVAPFHGFVWRDGDDAAGGADGGHGVNHDKAYRPRRRPPGPAGDRRRLRHGRPRLRKRQRAASSAAPNWSAPTRPASWRSTTRTTWPAPAPSRRTSTPPGPAPRGRHRSVFSSMPIEEVPKASPSPRTTSPGPGPAWPAPDHQGRRHGRHLPGGDRRRRRRPLRGRRTRPGGGPRGRPLLRPPRERREAAPAGRGDGPADRPPRPPWS
ncbi:hypothetical protein STENM327S_03859 [Streptomyces tendae]